tara:strand:- start:74 stop:277 length:204 start_codon:yes stop_codon:yes gene_type:complete
MIYPKDWKIRIAQAIVSINPKAEVTVDETTEEIKWVNGTTEISMSDIKAKQAELQTKVDNGQDVGDI